MNATYCKDEVLNRDTTPCDVRPSCKRDAFDSGVRPSLLGQYEVTQSKDSTVSVLQIFKIITVT